MKIFSMLFFTFFYIQAQCQQIDSFLMKGRLNDLKHGSKVFLTKEKDTAIVSSTIVVDNEFQLKFPIDFDGIFFALKVIDTVNSTKKIPLLLERSNVLIAGSTSAYNMRGSRSYNEFKRFTDANAPYKAILRKGISDSSSISRIDSIPNQLLDLRLKFIRENPNSAYTPFLIKTTAQLSDSLKEQAYQALTEYAKNSHYGRQLKEMLATNFRNAAFIRDVSIGAKAPNFVSLDTNRDSLGLYSIIKTSKLLLLDFWASWCAPCRAENPNLRRIYDTFSKDGFTILSVSFDFKEDPWKKAISQDTMPWFHVSDLKGRDAVVHKMYNINGIPDNFLIDNSGNIVARNLRGEDLFQKVKILLRKE